jgi:glucosamine-6-phosphate deaminase
LSAEFTAATGLRAVVSPSPDACGRAAAERTGSLIREAVAAKGGARVLFASAPSQEAFLAALVALDLPWGKVEAFHVDEYVGIAHDAPQAFGQWLDDRLFSRVPVTAHRFETGGDPEAEARRYGAAVLGGGIDIACIGIGVNGHIAFNEPYQWYVDDPEPVRLVTLAERSRRQQVDDGCFAAISEVPTTALTLTIPTLLSAGEIVVTVPGAHKAAAVAATLAGELSPAVPASALGTHGRATLFLDRGSASALAGVS